MSKVMDRRPWEWGDDEVVAACLDYTTRSEIHARNLSAFVCIEYRDLWHKLTWIRGRGASRGKKMTDEEIIELSKEYAAEGRGGFQKAEPGPYMMAYRRGLLEKMPWLDDPQGRTTHQILESTRTYATVGEFKKADPAGYQTLKKRGALDAITWFDTDETKSAEEIANHNAFIESIRNGTTDDLIRERKLREEARLAAAVPQNQCTDEV